MLISPTEPPRLRAAGTTSLLPESYGADVLWSAHGRWVGVQRKEVRDLLASVEDGRLGQQLAQMKQLECAVLLIEGELRFTLDGALMMNRHGGDSRWTKRSILGVLWSARRAGVWVDFTRDVAETVQYCEWFEAWTRKEKHTGMSNRPGPVGMWGKADSREWAAHLLQGFPGVGPELAGRIVERFGGAPLAWTVGVEDLTTVQGIGKKKIEGLMGALAKAEPPANKGESE